MPLLIKNRNKFPVSVRRFQCLKGICIGGCVDKKDKVGIKGVSAHSHCLNTDSYQGWVCFHHKWQLKSATMLHEIAHLLINTNTSVPSHGRKWLDKFVEIGGDIFSHEYRSHLERHWPWLKQRINDIIFLRDYR